MPWVAAPDDQTQQQPVAQSPDQQQQGGWQPAPPDADFVPHARVAPPSPGIMDTVEHIGHMASHPADIIGKDAGETVGNVAEMAAPFLGGAGVEGAGTLAAGMKSMFGKGDTEGQETLPPATTAKQQAQMQAMKNISPARASADKLQAQMLKDAGVDPHEVADRLEANQQKGLPLVALDEVQRDELNDPTGADNILSMVSAAGNKPGTASQLSRGLVRRGDMQRQQIKSQLEDTLSGDSTSKLNDEALMQLANQGKQAQDLAFSQGKEGEPITSPRLQEIVKDPMVMNGIKYGIRTQQIRSLGNPLEPFDPFDYSVHGLDNNGDMIVGQYPNMRALDAGRKGLGSLIDQEVAGNNGKYTERAAAMVEAKSNLTDELSRLNPHYANYLQTVGEPLANQAAMEQGRNIMNMRPDEVQDFVNGNATRFKAGMTPKLQEPASQGGLTYFKAGAKEALADRLADSKDDATVLDKVWKQNTRDRLTHVVGPEGMEQLNGHMQDQRAMMRSNRAFGGSNTFDKFAANEALKDATDEPILSHAAKAARFIGKPERATADFFSQMLGDKVKNQAESMSNETAAELMRDYTSRDPTVWRDLATRLKGQ